MTNGVKVKGFELLHHTGTKQVDDIILIDVVAEPAGSSSVYDRLLGG